MKNILLVLLVLITVSCSSETKYGKCVGLSETQDEKLIYKIDTLNVVLGIIFLETIFVPVIVVIDELYCPVGLKEGAIIHNRQY